MGGLGQVGGAICALLKKNKERFSVLDKSGDFQAPLQTKYDFLHVAIPYSDYFLQSVRACISSYSPAFVIVHSTVPVGTTRKLGSFVAHSPVRGQHDSLEGGLLKFKKYIGAHSDKTRQAVASHLRSLGITVDVWNRPEDTELMKLLCLSRYLNDIAFYETAFKTCRKFGVAPIRLVQWTNSYNDGYAGTKWVRPELTFPMGKVGGHCVMPVSKMLSGQTGYKFFRKNLDVFVGDCRR